MCYNVTTVNNNNVHVYLYWNVYIYAMVTDKLHCLKLTNNFKETFNFKWLMENSLHFSPWMVDNLRDYIPVSTSLGKYKTKEYMYLLSFDDGKGVVDANERQPIRAHLH